MSLWVTAVAGVPAASARPQARWPPDRQPHSRHRGWGCPGGGLPGWWVDGAIQLIPLILCLLCSLQSLGGAIPLGAPWWWPHWLVGATDKYQSHAMPVLLCVVSSRVEQQLRTPELQVGGAAAFLCALCLCERRAFQCSLLPCVPCTCPAAGPTRVSQSVFPVTVTGSQRTVPQQALLCL